MYSIALVNSLNLHVQLDSAGGWRGGEEEVGLETLPQLLRPTMATQLSCHVIVLCLTVKGLSHILVANCAWSNVINPLAKT